MSVDKKIDLIVLNNPSSEFGGPRELEEGLKKWKKENPNTRIVDYKIVPSYNDRHTIYIFYIEISKREIITENHDTN
jgi:hypothetical protein